MASMSRLMKGVDKDHLMVFNDLTNGETIFFLEWSDDVCLRHGTREDKALSESSMVGVTGLTFCILRRRKPCGLSLVATGGKGFEARGTLPVEVECDVRAYFVYNGHSQVFPWEV